MNWQKDMERMVAGWTDMQQRMWDSWMDSVKQFSQGGLPQGDVQQAYQQNLEAWERSVQDALEAQKAWARKWSEAVGGPAEAPEAARAYSEQVQTMMQGWTESQRQLWSAWFESVREMDPQQLKGPWEGESRQVMEAWQQAAERARETLENWAKSMPLGDLAGAAGEAPKPTARNRGRAKPAPRAARGSGAASRSKSVAGTAGKNSTAGGAAKGTRKPRAATKKPAEPKSAPEAKPAGGDESASS